MTASDASARVAPPRAERDAPSVDVKPGPTQAAEKASRAFVQPLRKSHRALERPPFDCVALVLQGGGALGAYQAGVYQALAEANLHPDWVAGISIGAINAALIAGNAPRERVSRSCAPSGRRSPRSALFDPFGLGALLAARRSWVTFSSTSCAPEPPCSGARPASSRRDFRRRTSLRRARSRPRASTTPRRCGARSSGWSTSTASMPARCASASARSTSAPATSSISTTTTHKIRPEHVMASGALPPGFPAVEIDGEFYWDGGLVSNTPLQWVLASRAAPGHAGVPGRPVERARRAAAATWPRSMARQKEIHYSSRTRADTDQFKQMQRVRAALAQPARKDARRKLRDSDGRRDCCAVEADRKVYNIVHLIYRVEELRGQSKDYEFSRRTMEEHWSAGYDDAVAHAAPSRGAAAARRIATASSPSTSPSTAANSRAPDIEQSKEHSMKEAEVASAAPSRCR